MKKIFNYIILDAARLSIEYEKIFSFSNEWDSLFPSDDEDALADVSAYLIKCSQGDEFSRWVLEGIGDSRGIFILSRVDFSSLLKHLRGLLNVFTESGEELYFRYYDPRVLRVFLPTCDSQQLKEFFGPIDEFIVEDDGGNRFIYFSLNNDKLVTSYKDMDSSINEKSTVEKELDKKACDFDDTSTIV